MNTFVHAQCICESETIGEGTRIGAFSHVLPNAAVGSDCDIGDHVLVGNEVTIGDRVTITSGIQLWDGIRLEDDVFLGANVTFANDKARGDKLSQGRTASTIVERAASIGSNSTILPGVTIGQHAVVEAGSVVTGNVPPYAIVRGNPGRIEGYVETESGAAKESVRLDFSKMDDLVLDTPVEGVHVHRLFSAIDLRGNLSVGEFGQHVPFVPKRVFMVYDVLSRLVRGEHAHRECHQFLIAVSGSVSIVVDDGHKRSEIELSEPGIGLHIPPMIWATQYKYSKGAVLLILASHHYDADDYIRDYEEFLESRV